MSTHLGHDLKTTPPRKSLASSFQLTAPDPEAELADLVGLYARRSMWFHRNPLVTLRALLLLLRLPRLCYQPSGRSESKHVKVGLSRTRLARYTVIQQARSVLELPEPGTPYNEGRSRATQRRKAREARRLGVTWRSIDDEAERKSLLANANEFERLNPRTEYRTHRPDNRDLRDIDLWLAAFHEDQPILLAVIPVDGEFATLRYFRTLVHTEASSASRYLMTEVLADHLVDRGVRYLVDRSNPLRTNRGVFHFARMVGFRIMRVRVA